MIESILPRGVRSAETFGDAVDAPLSAEEESVVADAVIDRRKEFATARACARRALRTIGVPPVSIGSGRHGDPLWPDAVVGSITHCEGYRAAAVARANSISSIGIDAEPALPLPPGLVSSIANPVELRLLAALTDLEPLIPWDRLVFSVKESTYKAWFALTRRPVGPREIQVELGPDRGLFVASVYGGSPARFFSGRWRVADGLLLTAASPLAR